MRKHLSLLKEPQGHGQDSGEVEKLLDIAAEFGNEVELTFNPAETAMVIDSLRRFNRNS